MHYQEVVDPRGAWDASQGSPTTHMTSHRRGPWSQSEDAYLMRLVQCAGPLNWVQIAAALSTRTPKQCRERFHQNLKPSLNHDPITPEEGRQIEQLVSEIGKRWAEIARRLDGRSDNAVKNWWNGSQNRRKRMDRRKLNHAVPTQPDLRPQPPYASYMAGSQGATPQTLPPLSRQMPLPTLPPACFNRARGIEAPLLSPPARSPGADSVDMAPSLMSDTGSCYSASPRGPLSHPCSPVALLPPLKDQLKQKPGTTLPALGALSLATHHFNHAGFGHGAVPVAHHYMGDASSQKSFLPTAPSSPVNLPALRQLSSRDDVAEDKGPRIRVSGLLN